MCFRGDILKKCETINTAVNLYVVVGCIVNARARKITDLEIHSVFLFFYS